MFVKYGVKTNGKWLQGIQGNEKYSSSASAPTMGDRHAHSEYETIWGTEQVLFERLTLTNYLKVLLEQHRWGDLKPCDVLIVAVKQE